VSKVPAVAADVLKLSWQDLQGFAATFCLDDLLPCSVAAGTRYSGNGSQRSQTASGGCFAPRSMRARPDAAEGRNGAAVVGRPLTSPSKPAWTTVCGLSPNSAS
jgi:hypothetical protein